MAKNWDITIRIVFVDGEWSQATFPFPPLPLLLLTAVKMGIHRMREGGLTRAISASGGYDLYLNNVWRHPDSRAIVVPEGSTIELIQTTAIDAARHWLDI